MNKINMNRRDFLKGLLAVSGGAVLAANLPLEWVVAEIEPKILSLPHRPFGAFGSVRLHQRWYPLNGASITMLRRHEFPPWTMRSEVIRPTVLPRGKEQGNDLIASPWQIEFEIGEMYEHHTQEVEFEIDSGKGIRFQGRGWVTEESTSMLKDQVMFGLTLEGIEKLERLF